MRALLASSNPHKAEELARSLPGWEIGLLGVELPPETGSSYYENARAKAEFGHTLRGDEWILGEDSGIEVAGLGGRPGIHSARWAAEAVEALLAELREVDGEGRRARYVCELVCLAPEGSELWAILDGKEVVHTAGVDWWFHVANLSGWRANCIADTRAGVILGTSDAHLYRIAGKGGEDRVSVLVDAAGYRERRAQTLRATADQAAQAAISRQRAVPLEAMSALERKVIHEHLKGRHDVETYSEGQEPSRHLVVAPLVD